MSRLEELYEKMVDEAPFNFPSSNREYVLEMAKIYAKEVAKASLEKASVNAEIIESPDSDYCDYVDKESITQESNIVLL